MDDSILPEAIIPPPPDCIRMTTNHPPQISLLNTSMESLSIFRSPSVQLIVQETCIG
ncbi:unnamed protein product [Debaryomyces tyrocola]|nr:unnamed protein product [Debaryomyces tyrocola]